MPNGLEDLCDFEKTLHKKDTVNVDDRCNPSSLGLKLLFIVDILTYERACVSSNERVRNGSRTESTLSLYC